MYPWISIFGLKIPSYLVVISCTYCLGIYYLFFRSEKRESIDRNISLNLAFIIMFSGLVGARLSHIIWEHWDYYKEEPLRVFYLWQGGFVFYGGAVLSSFIGILYLKNKRQNIGAYLDLLAPVLTLGYAIGRLSCFVAGCCFGRSCDLAWAVHYPTGVEAPPFVALHPAPLYAVLWGLVHWLFLIKLENSHSAKLLRKKGDLFSIALGIHSLGRLMMEYFRGDFRGPEIVGVSLSSSLSILLLILAIGMYLKKSRNS